MQIHLTPSTNSYTDENTELKFTQQIIQSG